jgi:phospholipid/cholesterol/gamma-HCH transport system permease protein
MNFKEGIFSSIRDSVFWTGDLVMFTGRTLKVIPKLGKRFDLFLLQCEFIGVSSFGILAVAAIFMGAVLGYQLYVSFSLFGAQALVGGTVGVAIFREMAPVIGAVMVTGRAGAAIGAEISSQRVSEQIDALEVMGVNPFEYLVLPRVMAGAAMMPLLAVMFGAIATISASLVTCGILGLNQVTFWTQFQKFVDWIDLLHCVCKGISFGVALSLLGCFFGFRAEGGARAVGFATRSTVVASCLVILLLDYFWTMILPFRENMLVVH